MYVLYSRVLCNCYSLVCTTVLSLHLFALLVDRTSTLSIFFGFRRWSHAATIATIRSPAA